jgi:hypothetical protein
MKKNRNLANSKTPKLTAPMKKRLQLFYFLTLLFSLQSVSSNAQSCSNRTFYVTPGGSGSQDGSSWANALSSLHAALANSCADTIKLAAGVYKPAQISRDSFFNIRHNAVLLGSYNPLTGLRDVDATPTIFSGDLGVVGDSSDNSKCVLFADSLNTVVLDGLVLRDSYREDDMFSIGCGFTGYQIQSLTINNCRFYRNQSLRNSDGGAMRLVQIGSYSITRCVVSENIASMAAGIYLETNPGASQIVSECIFYRNTALDYAASIYVDPQGDWIIQPGITISNCLFLENESISNPGIAFAQNVPARVINCTFGGNIVTPGGSHYGACISISGVTPGIPIEIANCFLLESVTQQSGAQMLFYDYCYLSPSLGAMHENVNAHHNLSVGGGIKFRHPQDPIGQDGRWFTTDDGIQLASCSEGVNIGDNASAVSSYDLSGRSRIYNNTIDIGAYESTGDPVWTGLLNVAADSLVANHELTDSITGWTHYYKDCRYLLSIKKQGQNIGTIGDGVFELKVKTNPSFGSGHATNLTAAAYNTSGLPWFVMNRYWNVKPTHPVQDSIAVRFPYTSTDFADVVGSNPMITQHTQQQFFKVTGTNNPFDLTVPLSAFTRYQHAASASLHTWHYLQQDTTHICEYYVSSFSGGGGGVQVANVSTAVPSIEGINSFSLSPNPGKGLIRLQMQTTASKKLSVTVSNFSGTIIYKKNFGTVSGHVIRELDLREKAVGVYFVQVELGTTRFVEKIIIAR